MWWLRTGLKHNRGCLWETVLLWGRGKVVGPGQRRGEHRCMHGRAGCRQHHDLRGSASTSGTWQIAQRRQERDKCVWLGMKTPRRPTRFEATPAHLILLAEDDLVSVVELVLQIEAMAAHAVELTSASVSFKQLPLITSALTDK